MRFNWRYLVQSCKTLFGLCINALAIGLVVTVGLFHLPAMATDSDKTIGLCYDDSAPRSMHLTKTQHRGGYAIDILAYIYQKSAFDLEHIKLQDLSPVERQSHCEITLFKHPANVADYHVAMPAIASTVESYWALYDDYASMVSLKNSDKLRVAVHRLQPLNSANVDASQRTEGAEPSQYNAVESYFEDLLQYRVDVLRVDAFEAEYTIAKNGWTGKFKQLPLDHPAFVTKPLLITPHLSTSSSRHATLLQLWSEGLRELHQSGLLLEFFSPYAIEDAPILIGQ